MNGYQKVEVVQSKHEWTREEQRSKNNHIWSLRESVEKVRECFPEKNAGSFKERQTQ